MTLVQGYFKLIIALLSITVQLTLSAKTNARPVYEIVNESKAEETLIKTSAVANLPYGNPLAGNSQQNAKLHAHNQQAMFNAERIRQHKAQLQQQQRWLKTPQKNNYMRSYHESEENHQLELERQAEVMDNITESKIIKDQKDTTLENSNQERKRKPRSHGAVYQMITEPSNDLKPNIINEMGHISNTGYIYRKYYPTQAYQSVQNIKILNSLLNKEPNEQLNEFNALINAPRVNNYDKELEAPIDLNFYHKEPSEYPLPEYHTNYAQIPIVQENKYIQKNPEELTNHVITPLYQEEYEEPTHEYLQYVPVFNNNAEKTDLNGGSDQHLTKDGSGVVYENHYAPSYEFGYRVRDTHSGNDFGHQEEKTGEETNGQYHVLLPDGRMQNVKYSAGPEGFNADISYDGRK